MTEATGETDGRAGKSAHGVTSRRLSPLSFAFALRDPARLLRMVADWPGDVAHIQIGKLSAGALKHPDLVQQLLVKDATQFEKGRTLERAFFFRFLGDGLLNSKGEAHRRQ